MRPSMRAIESSLATLSILGLRHWRVDRQADPEKSDSAHDKAQNGRNKVETPHKAGNTAQFEEGGNRESYVDF